jgi:formylglycine-generating enzyme required for sulfatase activity
MPNDPIALPTPDADHPPAAPAIMPGVTVGRFRIASVLGGSTYEAVDPLTQERVALRPLPDVLTRDPQALKRLRALVQSLLALSHPNIVAPAVEKVGGDGYLVMEFLGGGSVADRLADRGLWPWREATRIAADACRALIAAHAAGLAHGHVTPSNLLLTHDGTVKLADFGAVVCASAGEAPDTYSDLRNLGAVYYAMLTGRPLGRPIDQPLPPVRAGAPDIPLRCEVVVRKALSDDVDDRYPSAEAMLADLSAVLAETIAPARPRPVAPPPRRRVAPLWSRLRPMATPIASIIALAVAGYLVFASRPPSRLAPKSSDSSAEGRPAAGLPTVTNSIGMKLARVPPGNFIMGDLLIGDARPHLVRISHGLLVGVYEVTQGEYQLVMNENPSKVRGDGLPVERVTWEEARMFCAKLSDRPEERALGRVYRLPTEAEWEYCCRAGTRTSFNCGPVITPQRANLLLSGLQRPTPAGTYPPNAWGLYDMHGNVWEWCADWYAVEYFVTSPVIDPPGPPDGTKRVMRGGSCTTAPDECRSGARNDTFAPDTRNAAVGFRVVCTEAAGGS